MFSSPIRSFLVFDGFTSKDEGFEPTILYEMQSNPVPSYFSVNQVGIFITLIKFSQFFSKNIPLEYTLTDKNETSLMELHDNVWMSISQNPSNSSNFHLLREILLSCKKIYNLFFSLPQRGKDGLITRNSKKTLNSVFEMILSALIKTNLTFIHLFDSFFQIDPKPDIIKKLFPLIDSLIKYQSPISNIAIMHSRHFIYSNFPIDITKTLAICLNINLPYLFPQVLAKDEEHLYWIIGLSRSESGLINVYAPPILVNNEYYPFIALRFKKIRILISLKPNIVPTPEVLNTIPRYLKPLKIYLNNLKIESNYGKFDGSYILLKHNKEKRMLFLSNQKISDTTIPLAESNIIMCYTFSKNFGKFAEIAFTGNSNYFILYLPNINNEEIILFCKTEIKEISNSINIIKELLINNNINSLKILLEK